MSGAVRDMALVDKTDQAMAPVAPPTINLSAMFEKLAANPDVSMDKLQALGLMQERILAREAEQQFNAAMAKAQTKMRPIAADLLNKQTQSRYASYAALDRVLRPIYTTEGFGLSFDTGDGAPVDSVRVLCYVTHAAGHARTYRIDMPADGKGARGGDVMTKTHAAGAAASYGMRYLLKMIWNVAVGEDDRDGNDPPPEREVKAPAGFEAWWLDLQAAADEGHKAFALAWNASDMARRKRLVATNSAGLEALKRKAADIDKTRGGGK